MKLGIHRSYILIISIMNGLVGKNLIVTGDMCQKRFYEVMTFDFSYVFGFSKFPINVTFHLNICNNLSNYEEGMLIFEIIGLVMVFVY